MKEDLLEDRIERFVRQNRGQFDDQEPDAKLWDGMSTNINTPRKSITRSLVWWRAAAVIFFVLTLGLLFNNYVPSTGISINEDTQFAQTEMYYSEQIKDKEQLIQVYLADYPTLNAEFTSDLEQLDDNYLLLKEEYKTNNSEIILDALIINLQSRIDLLNKQLSIIRSINEQNNEVNI